MLVGCEKKVEESVVAQQLNLNIPTDPATLDPRKGGDLISSTFHFLLFEGLVRINDNGVVAPALAHKIDLSPDRKVYTFHLRDAFWSDRSPITAWDFEKSWKDILHPDFPSMNAHLLYPILNAEGAKKGTASLSEVGIRSIDAKTLEVTLEKPTPYFLELASFCVFFPVNAEVDHTHPDWDQESQKQFICSGPFQMKEWKRNNEIVLKRNPHYWRSERVILDEIHINIVSSEMTSLQMFEKGQIDILGQPLMPLPTDAIPELMKKDLLKIHPVPATTFCVFNTEGFPFHNQKIRKAFGLAINRRDIVRNITQLSELPALTMIPPILKRRPSAPLYRDADREAARALFAEGCKELGIRPEEFPKISYLYSNLESHHKIAQAIQQQWADVLGVQVELQSADKKILMHNLQYGAFQIAQSFWIAQFREPMNILDRFKYKSNVKNYPRWENQRYIQLLNDSYDVETDEERFFLLEEAEKLLVDEMPVVPLFHWNSAYIHQPYVKSYSLAPIGEGFYDRIYIDTALKQKGR